jgi:hypothetical protein
MRRQTPLLKGYPLIKGFLCGSLFIGSVAAEHIVPLRVLIFIIAGLVFMDAVFKFGDEPHILSFLAMVGIGLFVGLIAAISGFVNQYVLVMLILITLVYTHGFVWPQKKGG